MDFTDLLYYDELSAGARAEARANVLASIIEAHDRSIAESLADWRGNMHTVINNRLHIPRIRNGAAALYNFQQKGDDYLIPYIRSNVITFTECGAYVYYIGRMEVITGGGQYIPTPEEQKQLIESYIAVNARGPAYHKQLYATWHRIKWNMIIPRK